jgi:hypothetical protein
MANPASLADRGGIVSASVANGSSVARPLVGPRRFICAGGMRSIIDGQMNFVAGLLGVAWRLAG